MVDKKKELEFLEEKYREMKKLNSETEQIISKLKNEGDINRENQLLEEKKELEKELDELKQKLQEGNKKLKELQNSNMVLLEELKESKRIRREKEIGRFQDIAAKKLKIDLEEKIIMRLTKFRKELTLRIGKMDKELMKDLSKESHQLRNELKELTEKVDIFMTEAAKKAEQARLELEGENSLFHSEIQKEYDAKEGEYIFEKEKKNLLLEKLIGLKGFNILGIISIFLGVFLVFRTQFKDILNNDYVKSVGAYLLGIVFLFVGERLYQKNKKHFAVGIIGGGIGILYLATMLSTMYLGLFPMYLGLLISVLLTGIVIVMALRYESEIIGVLSLIGGYVPYGAYIYYLKGDSQIYYIIAYSLVLQGIVLGIAWKKDWMYSKVIGFMIGAVNMAGLVFYMKDVMGDKLTAFFYIVIFTTAYSYIFLNTHKKEKRDSKVIDYILLSVNLILKFSLIYSLSDGTTPTWIKAILIIGVGVVYGFIGDRIKENHMAKILYVIALGCFIIIIPVILSKDYIVAAWGAETLLIYFLAWKYKNREIEYAALFIYLVTFISNLFMRTEKYYLVYMQDFMIIAISFALYFMLKKRNLKKGIKEFLGVYKYFIFLYSIYFIGSITNLLVGKTFMRYTDRYIFSTVISLFMINIILRTVTYKVKELQDRFSLPFLMGIEIISLLGVMVLNMAGIYRYNWDSLKTLQAAMIIGLNIYLFLYARKDIHLCIFKSNEKKFQWILGESIYIFFVSYVVMVRVVGMRGRSANLVLDIIGLLMCGYLVWKGFRTPNRTVRRTGLGIGIFFVLKCFFFDFVRFDSTFKLMAYFGMGAILIGTSYIYQTALKKLEKEEKGEKSE